MRSLEDKAILRTKDYVYGVSQTGVVDILRATFSIIERETLVGVGSLAITADGRSAAAATVQRVAVLPGMRRSREPAPDDYWAGFNDARKAGTTPIYRGEPGYRAAMDGDDDDVACEPPPS